MGHGWPKGLKMGEPILVRAIKRLLKFSKLSYWTETQIQNNVK
jgi:hypothetical protein